MTPRHISVLTILCLSAGSVVGLRSSRSVYHYGPPAPLNQDGTVASTPEVQNPAAAQKAAFAAEFNRLHQAEQLAAAHPDFTSPSFSKGNQNLENYIQFNQGKSYYAQSYYPAPLNQDGTVANTPEVRNAAAAQKAAFAAEFNRLREADQLAAAHPDFTSPSYSKGNQNVQNNIQYNQGKSYNVQTYNPAPLNQDGTVALTPEVQAAKAAHQAAYAAEFQRYQEGARLAAAHPDLTSPREGYGTSSGHYGFDQHGVQQYNVQQHGLQQSSYTYNPAARIPAPLNYDGTVAHTAEYNAIAAAHQVEYAKAYQNAKYQNQLNQFKREPSSNNNKYW